MSDIKPEIGEIVNFYDPYLVSRIGFGEGYGGRGKGPYAAIVVNDQDGGLDLFVFYPAKQPGFVQEKVREDPGEEVVSKEAVPKPYWSWRNASQKARATARAKQ